VRGQVVTLATAIKALGLDVCPDSEATAKQMVLLSEDRSVIALLPDDASRALLVDRQLQNRVIEVKGKRHPGLPYLQVVTFKVEWEGRFQTPEYYCNICTIIVRFPQSCPCCQGAMELRMKPERR
jgi:hypothetical protein